jgi:predicted O-methyltransferase YrrM
LSWKDVARAVVPLRIRQLRMDRRDRLGLKALGRIPCDSAPLSTAIGVDQLRQLIGSRRIDQEWSEVEPELLWFRITESADGVNPGDRRAIFYLLRGLGAKSVLEIGTHVGASAVYTVAALTRNCSTSHGESPRLTTVDITDVNDERKGPWKKRNSTHAPKEMISRMGAAGWVSFVTAASLDYFRRCAERFDFIFLDGDHSAQTVYQEIPAALRLLNPDGVILLHDYFPMARPLWSDGAVIPGPWAATERLRSEGAPIRILPFAELPWPTKQNSRVSSLALLVGIAR